MKKLLLLLLITCSLSVHAQWIDSLNTAKNCTYMKLEEREMIYEINQMRSNPAGYVQFIQPLLDHALATLKSRGKGQKNYALQFTYGSNNAMVAEKVDTIWNYSNEEEVKALQSLVKDLNTMKPLSVLQPDSGIYVAVTKFSKDQDNHHWELMHTGSDGSQPWDRIRKHSPKMKTGNENIAGNSEGNVPRDFVIQLLIDSGIPGYGHRYNLFDPSWTHTACFGSGKKDGMYRWIQNFGAK